MTNEEAINHVTCGRILIDKQKDRELRDFLIGSLEKQIPKRPIIEKFGYRDIRVTCPCCCHDTIYMYVTRGKNYCSNCGQRYDWSDDG